MTKIRLRCCVPFCQHTRGERKGDKTPIREGQEWICAKHWMALPKALRRVRYRLDRQFDKAMAAEPHFREWWKIEDEERRIKAILLWNRYKRCWRQCKKLAIERGMGI